MKLAFTARGWAHYGHWQKNDRMMVRRINRLIDETLRDPENGIGKPEMLRYERAGVWSRRITAEHRLVYEVRGDLVLIWQCRFHYGS
ncbi:Txe/YoeB family addiction module toxin [Subtercola sp. Z020]|uniref:Txe/YoeB family addiction module toxin n=1 Tax=Subtercola sp. Z020 TaxID=2080582 RepID=UPI000CE859C4|nr:Txe/YoeB family addiction module toxin [Subtercola sp. Z020]PPF89705.1 Txe/YoeB family addiction module toxin [Subtercola sp. Z020]